MELTQVQTIAVWILPIIFAVTVHEVAHGYVACLLGDKTAKILGRLTLNPIKHIDPIGTIILPAVLLLLNTGIILGWAKPVPINPYNFANYRRDSALVALAGPMANLLMVIAWASIAKISSLLLIGGLLEVQAIYLMGMAGVSINLMLMVLNLLPIPPLDGSHIVASLLPPRIATHYNNVSSFGFIILIFLIYFGVINFIASPIISFLYSFVCKIFSLS